MIKSQNLHPADLFEAKRKSLNGIWVLDKTRGSPSIRGYLETMGVDELAIRANEKGEQETDTMHDITLTSTSYKIHKLSRVNDLTLDLTLGKEHVEQLRLLPDGSSGTGVEGAERTRRTLATIPDIQKDSSNNSEEVVLDHVRVESTMGTMNGVARVLDVKKLIQDKEKGEGEVVYVQNLTIWNESTGKEHTTTRYFIPFHGQLGPTALTAGGKVKKGLDVEEEGNEAMDPH
mmetsp:Transcript_15436/g.22011  ORF Transcript_15436/g.22011 Transcript_15436/m.22011 type:complete len:232 (+) Transcript_15436:115-810(+)|eukprot:CAMPEP_0184858588 /NCGR_PEP_ID=MMETSP0580-20130426/3672_1 /TAXON_ID=1118495 /ORGANISM="Dactyliosolen fragilissimus" /LENGTH=231 /DNA_ID=CAMNT_0027354813 /DNA_START=81 /DNA_END=776 /DNA_ORIENTATION=+